MTVAERKKRIEQTYLDEARRASTLFPEGTYEEHERPDFLVRTERRVLGIEITALCNEEPRAVAGRLGNVVHISERKYRAMASCAPVDVVVSFSPRAEQLHYRELSATLLDVVSARQAKDAAPEIKSGAWQLFERGFLHIGVHEPIHNGGRWTWIRGFETTLAPEELVRSCIADKETRVAEYRRTADEVWLLIVNDLFLGPGEVHARHEDLARWVFPSSFDKVLVFSRQPGGSGTVFELGRVQP